MQRFKSSEMSSQGTHWAISQHLEFTPQENLGLTGASEIKEAQKIQYEDAKLRWRASLRDVRREGPKGGRGKGSGKEESRKGDGKKGSKGGQKPDGGKKAEESGRK